MIIFNLSYSQVNLYDLTAGHRLRSIANLRRPLPGVGIKNLRRPSSGADFQCPRPKPSVRHRRSSPAPQEALRRPCLPSTVTVPHRDHTDRAPPDLSFISQRETNCAVVAISKTTSPDAAPPPAAAEEPNPASKSSLLPPPPSPGSTASIFSSTTGGEIQHPPPPPRFIPRSAPAQTLPRQQWRNGRKRPSSNCRRHRRRSALTTAVSAAIRPIPRSCTANPATSSSSEPSPLPDSSRPSSLFRRDQLSIVSGSSSLSAPPHHLFNCIDTPPVAARPSREFTAALAREIWNHGDRVSTIDELQRERFTMRKSQKMGSGKRNWGERIGVQGSIFDVGIERN